MINDKRKLYLKQASEAAGWVTQQFASSVKWQDLQDPNVIHVTRLSALIGVIELNILSLEIKIEEAEDSGNISQAQKYKQILDVKESQMLKLEGIVKERIKNGQRPYTPNLVL